MFLMSMLYKNDFMLPFMPLKFVNTKYKNVKNILISRKSKIYHQPFHAYAYNPVKNPASAAKITTFNVFLMPIVATNSQVISRGKNTTHASLSACPNNVLPKNAEFTAIIKPAKKPPKLPAIFLAIRNTSKTDKAETKIG